MKKLSTLILLFIFLLLLQDVFSKSKMTTSDMEILSFNAIIREDEIHIGWLMNGRDVKVDLEKSVAGKDYIIIESYDVEESHTFETYHFIDSNLDSELIRYRLKWFENNRIKCSETIQLQVKNK